MSKVGGMRLGAVKTLEVQEPAGIVDDGDRHRGAGVFGRGAAGDCDRFGVGKFKGGLHPHRCSPNTAPRRHAPQSSGP